MSTSTRLAPVPVRVCAQCHTCHRTDCCGQLSVGHRAWYCSPSCYQIQRVLMGEPMTREQLQLLSNLRNEHYPDSVLTANREHTSWLMRSRQIKVVVDKSIRDEHGDNTD